MTLFDKQGIVTDYVKNLILILGGQRDIWLRLIIAHFRLRILLKSQPELTVFQPIAKQYIYPLYVSPVNIIRCSIIERKLIICTSSFLSTFIYLCSLWLGGTTCPSITVFSSRYIGFTLTCACLLGHVCLGFAAAHMP